MRQTSEGSFSAVSKPNFASKYAFESSRRDLHNALLCTAPKSHFFQKISRICQNLRKFSEILRNSQFFKPIFCENFEIAAVQKDANLVDLEKCCRTHIYLQRSASIQPRTSLGKSDVSWPRRQRAAVMQIIFSSPGSRKSRRASSPPPRPRPTSCRVYFFSKQYTIRRCTLLS